MTFTSTHDDAAATGVMRDRQIAHLAFNFVVDMTADCVAGLKPLEMLLVMAINQANIAPLTRDPAARKRYGALEAPAPDAERRPVSVRAVAASMRLPYETARRNIRSLEARGACMTSEAGIVVPAGFLQSPAYLETARVGHIRLRTLYLMLDARGLLEPLPAANYDEAEPPIRGAVRLMSDYILRAAEALVSRMGDLTAGIVMLPLVVAAAAETDPPAALGASALARRIGVPNETVRRKLAALEQEGTCQATAGGYRVADTQLASAPWSGLLRDNAIAVQRLFAGLAERGVIAAWERERAGATAVADGG